MMRKQQCGEGDCENGAYMDQLEALCNQGIHIERNLRLLILQLEARLITIHKIIPPPPPAYLHVTLIDAEKVKLFDEVQKVMYDNQPQPADRRGEARTESTP